MISDFLSVHGQTTSSRARALPSQEKPYPLHMECPQLEMLQLGASHIPISDKPKSRSRAKRRKNLTFSSTNPNCFNTFKSIVFPELATPNGSDVIMIQEAKLWPKDIDAAKQWAKSVGWKLYVAPCIAGPNGDPSSGVAVMTRSYLNAGPQLISDDPIVVNARVIAVPMRLALFGVIYVYSLYLVSSIGITGDNIDIIKSFAAHVKAHGRPFIAGGDHNCPPEKLLAELLKHLDKVDIVASSSDTFYRSGMSSKIDYFLADTRISISLQPAFAHLSSLCSPHKPVSTAWDCDGFQQTVTMMPRPLTLPVAPPFGPRAPQAVDWSDILTDFDTVADRVLAIGHCLDPSSEYNDLFEQMMDRWVDAATEELLDTLGIDQSLSAKMNKQIEPETKKLSTIMAVDHKLNIYPSKIYQGIAGRFSQLAALISKPFNPSGKVTPLQVIFLLRNSVVNCRCHPTLRSELAAHPLHMLVDWVENFLSFHVLPLPSHVVDNVIHIAEVFDRAASDSRKTEMADARYAWRAFAQSSFRNGASLAFRLTKPKLPSDPKPVIDNEGNLSLCQADRLLDMSKTLASFWKAEDSAPPPFNFGDVSRIPLLGRMDPQHILNASASFKLKTAKADGWHPRHFSLLTLPATKCLSVLLLLYEACGDLPPK